jgi:Mn-dependent DtxR family transcriptional regulator
MVKKPRKKRSQSMGSKFLYSILTQNINSKTRQLSITLPELAEKLDVDQAVVKKYLGELRNLDKISTETRYIITLH